MSEELLLKTGPGHRQTGFRSDDRAPEDMDVTRMVEVGVQIPARLDPAWDPIQRECWQTAEDHGWHDKPASFGDRIALIHSEASEALEEYRDGHEPTETYYVKDDKPEGVPSELADIVIRVMDFAESYGVDLSAAMREKMTFNKTRPYRHGGKAI